MNPDDSVIVSIPFSGTRYLRQALNIPRCAHTYVPPERLLEYVESATNIVVPLRRPEDNWASWARRWPEGKPWDRRIAEFERAWIGMAWFLEYMSSEIVWEAAVDTTVKTTIKLYPDYKFPESDFPQIGSEDEGNNSYDYDVSHLYRYSFIKEYYK